MSTETTDPPHSLLDNYHSLPDVHDEMLVAPGLPRPAWSETLQRLGDLGIEELTRRDRESQRLIKENGVTYNLYGTPGETSARAWPCNLMPHIIAADDWELLSDGLKERAEVLNLLLHDLYGARALIRTGVIPLELVDAAPSYLRPCRYLMPSDQRLLYLYAADLARKPDGSFVVLEDRTQAPSGSGYALENRIILSRVLSDLYRNTWVHRLALFFHEMITTLQACSPGDEYDPRIVLLTPGPRNETYFEHSYLAHYLGINLVEGSDLVVRDQCVWLRTLDGLERVHGIIRRVDDTFCDPLELRPDSVLGVPGLLSAIRAGNVLVVNPPGVGICESLGVNAFLPEIARKLLGRDLRLPSTRAWWCGRDQDRGYVLDNLDGLLIRSIDGRGFVPRAMSKSELEGLVASITSHPGHYAARELQDLSTTPVFTPEGLEPRGFVLRAFVSATSQSYAVMPGGLTRVAAQQGIVSVSNQDGGISKDTWILAEQPPSEFSLLPKSMQPTELRRHSGDLASRVVENLFWLGRYAERADGLARMLRSVVVYLLEVRTNDDSPCPADILAALTRLTTSYPGFIDNPLLQSHPDFELLALLADRGRGGSLAYTLDCLRRAGLSSRDSLSDEMWRLINSLGDGLPNIGRVGDAVEPLSDIVIQVSALAGLVSNSMARGPAHWFVDAGRRIERGQIIVNLLRSGFILNEELTSPLATVLLDVSDSVMTYRRRYKSRLHPAGVLDLLFTDESNPRSLVFQLLRLHEHLHLRWGKRDASVLLEIRQRVFNILRSVRGTDVDTLDQNYREPAIRAFLDRKLLEIDHELRHASDVLCAYYFAQIEIPRQLVELA